jgi:hypothetical protein
MQLPADVHARIHQQLVAICSRNVAEFTLGLDLNHLLLLNYSQKCEERVNTLDATFDLAEFGYVMPRTLEPVHFVQAVAKIIPSMQQNLYNLRREKYEYFIEIAIMNNLLRNTKRIHAQISEIGEKSLLCEASSDLLRLWKRENQEIVDISAKIFSCHHALHTDTKI